MRRIVTVSGVVRRAILVGLSVLSAAPAAAQTADSIAAKYVAATGGAEKWAALQNLTVQSRSPFVSFDSIWTRSGKLRLDVWSDAGPDTDVRVFDGKSGWVVNSREGAAQPRALSEKELVELREEIDSMRELVDHKIKGISLTLLEPETAGGDVTHRLRVVRPSGATLVLFLNAATGLEIKRVKSVTSPDGTSEELVTLVGDYRDVGGLLLPHTVGAATRTYQANTAVPDSRFFWRPRQP